MTKKEQDKIAADIFDKMCYIEHPLPFNEKVMVYYPNALEAMQEYAKEYAQQLVLDKLPGDDFINKVHNAAEKLSWEEGMRDMRSIAIQSLTTRNEVEKPYRELLDLIIMTVPKKYLSDITIERINQLLSGGR